MVRSDIQIFHKLNKIVEIKSCKNIFTFSKDESGMIKAFCSTELTRDMLADIITSRIASVMSYKDGILILSPKFGYNILKFQDVIVSIFEKFNL
jgi:hypothetical protein